MPRLFVLVLGQITVAAPITLAGGKASWRS